MRRLRHRKILGEAIRAYRKKAALSQEALAEAAELSLNFVGEVERGNMECSVTSLVKIARALGVQVGDLVGTTNIYRSLIGKRLNRSAEILSRVPTG